MNKFQHEIDKLLKLLYEDCNINVIDIEKLKRVEGRISNDFSTTAYDLNSKKHIIAHFDEICGDEPQCQICYIKKFCTYYRRQAEYIVKPQDLKIVDLFCGAGGFSLGFTQAGFKTVFAIDNQECCIDTYRHNHPDISERSIVCKNIELVDLSENIANNLDIDVVIGGPPCQGFSMANRQRMINDPRNRLYKQFVKNIEKMKPKFFVMENVEGILKIENEIIEDFALLEEKYQVVPIKVNAVDFGVPQNRKRVFFIGTRLELDLSLVIERIKQLAKEQPKTVLDDALFGLRSLEAGKEKNKTTHDSIVSGSIIEINKIRQENEYIKRINCNKHSPFVFNHKARYNNERDVEIFSLLDPGDRSDDPKIANIMPYKNRNDIFKDKYYRLQGNKSCKTITAHMKYDGNMYINPYQARGLTPREAARVQSYPDDYFFCGPYTKTYMQVGNSVPPMVAKIIAEVIKETILKNKQEIKIQCQNMK